MSTRALQQLKRHKTEQKNKGKEAGEAARICRLPVLYGGAPDLTNLVRLPSGTMSLYPIQSQALYEAKHANGLFAPIGVGEGKTLISLLLPRVFGAKRPVLLLPPTMVETFERERKKFATHFAVSDRLVVIKYSMLSVASGAYLLDRSQPDLIIADEAHYLRNVDSTRTKRVIRYLRNNPQTRFCAMSGTLTKRSLKDYAHLIYLALKSGTPLPLNWSELECWANTLDSDGVATKYDWGRVRPFFDRMTRPLSPKPQYNRDNLRTMYQKRLVSTPGVVASKKSRVDASLYMISRRPTLPTPVLKAMKFVEKTWSTPGGEEELDTPMAFARVQRQLAQGFYYKWDWPGGVPDSQWLRARAQWRRAVRAILTRNQPGLDSPLLIYNAVKAGRLTVPEIVQAYTEWEPQKDKPQPPTVPVWISDYLVRDSLEWAKRAREPVILWYEHQATADLLARYGCPVFGQGTELPEHPRTLAASIRVHGTGKNLQAWRNQIVMCPPSSGQTWEQLLGRMHRTGQTADEVLCHYYDHVDVYASAVAQARLDAEYVQRTYGSKQKLCYAAFSSKTA